MKTHFKLFFMIICANVIVIAQQASSDFPKLSGLYLGQKPPGMIPELFAPGIISTGNHEHSRIEFSKDGSEMYWAVIPILEGKFKTDEQKIWSTKNERTGWSQPKPIPVNFQNTQSPVIHPVNQNFYFRTRNPKDSLEPENLIWLKSKEDTSWNRLKQVNSLLPQIKGKTTMSFCFSNNGNLYFDIGGPDKQNNWNWKIYCSEYKNDSYAQPVILGNGINDSEINWCPFISPDESYLIFSSHREGSFGDGDLYISFKDKNDSWSTPINLGCNVNTSSQERFPSVSPDGKYLFFARHNDNKTYSDIYWVDVKVIEELRPKE